MSRVPRQKPTSRISSVGTSRPDPNISLASQDLKRRRARSAPAQVDTQDFDAGNVRLGSFLGVGRGRCEISSWRSPESAICYTGRRVHPTSSEDEEHCRGACLTGRAVQSTLHGMLGRHSGCNTDSAFLLLSITAALFLSTFTASPGRSAEPLLEASQLRVIVKIVNGVRAERSAV